MTYLVCANCDYRIPEQRFHGQYHVCPQCQFGLRSETLDEGPEGVKKRYKPVFTGTAGEYFRIWIVNTFLTIVTLGIYAAWAKVRTRQYFYANTLLADQSFDYKANPVAILKGNLIVGIGFIIYMLCQQSYPYVSLGVLLAFYVFLPFLVYKSLRFNMHNSAFRNIRFRFLGGLGESYRTYLLIPFLFPLTLGLIFPYWAFRRKKYFFDNVAYGTTSSDFNGVVGPFYSVYFAVFLMGIAMAFAMGITTALLTALLAIIRKSLDPSMMLPMAIMMIAYLFMFIGMTTIEQFIFSRLTNYSLNNTTLGDITFESTLNAQRLIGIRITNILAILFSFGLLIPWAKVRRTKYILDNITVLADTDLDAFVAGHGSDESAYGDAATDFIDFEIGL